MPVPFRSDLIAFLDEFAEHHRGIRRGKMFGLPAIYVGRRLVTCLIEDGIIIRLPADVARREVQSKRGTAFSRRGRAMGSWVMYEPRTRAAAQALTRIIETSVRHVAERMTQDLTGIAAKRRKRS
jgi:hypothetical protein